MLAAKCHAWYCICRHLEQMKVRCLLEASYQALMVANLCQNVPPFLDQRACSAVQTRIAARKLLHLQVHGQVRQVMSGPLRSSLTHRDHVKRRQINLHVAIVQEQG